MGVSHTVAAAQLPLTCPDKGLRGRSGRVLQRKCACSRHAGTHGECTRCRDDRRRRRSTDTPDAELAPAIVHEVLRSPGQPLDRTARAGMEARFGHDLSAIRVHTDSRAAASARTVGATGYTVGRDIVFAAGRYAPETADGRRLLTHEVAHAIQQGVRANGVSDRLPIAAADSPLEAEADAVANSLPIERVPAPPVHAPRLRSLHRQSLQRDPDEKNPPPEPAKPMCDFTGSVFTKIPHGSLTASVNGNQLESPIFDMEAHFRVTQTAHKDILACTCSCGEYRQLVRGKFTKNGQDVPLELCNSQKLDPKTFHEDCKHVAGTDLSFGDRSRLMQSIPGLHNKYSNPDIFFPDSGKPTDKALGCTFEAKDQPKIKGSSGDQLGLQLEFYGQLIDTCHSDQVLDQESWTVFGSGKLP